MMLLNYSTLPDELKKGMLALEKYGFLKTGDNGTVIRAHLAKQIEVTVTTQELCIEYDTEAHFYMALARSFGMSEGSHTIDPKVKELGFMLDCSRNAVPKPEMIKQLICILVLAGYNYLELYTEDTYELPGEPYFGYMRGRYSREELEEIVAFATIFGMEVRPCIQTLAHLNALANWGVYFEHMDVSNTLLVGDEKTYALIRKIIRYCKEVFQTHRIHIGTDEAFRLGRGKYLDKHGYRPKHEIYLEHLKKVFEICKEEGVVAEFWADAFYDAKDEEAVINDIFDGTQIPIYWDYDSLDPEYHNQKIQHLKKLTGKVTYAGGLCKWIGYAPDNHHSDCVTKVALEAAIQNGVDDVLMTAWGNDGDECSVYAIIPSMWYACQRLYVTDADINIMLEALTNYTDAEWRLSDELNHTSKSDKQSNAAKYLLYNDFIIGLLDYHIPDDAGCVYEDLLPKFEQLAGRNSQFSYIFRFYADLCRILMRKATFGKRIYEIYQNRDKEKMACAIMELSQIKGDIQKFHNEFRSLWMRENKGYGFEVMDLRVGGMVSRADTVIMLLRDYLDGRTDKIYELEAERLDYWCGTTPEESRYSPMHNLWQTMYTVNNIIYPQ